MASITPVFTDNVSVIGAQSLSRGSRVKATLDLSSKEGAYLMAAIGRTGTTALSAGVRFSVYRLINAGGIFHPVAVAQRLSILAAATETTINSDSNSGTSVANVTSESGFLHGDIVTLQDAGGGVTRFEFGEVYKTATGAVHLISDLQFTHTSAQADKVRNKADAFAPIWLPGGAKYLVDFDYSESGTGESVIVRCLAQTLDSYTAV